MPPKKEKIEPEPVKSASPSKVKYFSRSLLLLSILLVLLGLNNFLDFLTVPEIVTDVALLVAGIWVLIAVLQRGFYKRRKEVLKRYI